MTGPVDTKPEPQAPADGPTPAALRKPSPPQNIDVPDDAVRLWRSMQRWWHWLWRWA